MPISIPRKTLKGLLAMYRYDPYPDIYREIVKIRTSGEAAVLVTVIEVHGSTPRREGAKMLVHADGKISGTVGGGVREADIIAEAKKLFNDGGARLFEVDFTEGITSGKGPVCGGRMKVFMEKINSHKRAVISGAGHIGWYLFPILKMLEFHVLVIDPREELNNQERFPGGELIPREFQEGVGDLRLTREDAVIIIGPGHEEDFRILPSVLDSSAGYIGMIGSKRKRKEVYDKLLEMGYKEDDLERIYSPVGLSIGSESPAEIAVAIAAEIVKHFNCK